MLTPIFKFHILNTTKRPLYVDANGNIVETVDIPGAALSFTVKILHSDPPGAAPDIAIITPAISLQDGDEIEFLNGGVVNGTHTVTLIGNNVQINPDSSAPAGTYSANIAVNGVILTGTDGTINWKKPNGRPANLEYSPDGWKETLVKFGRSLFYLSLFRDMTVPMTFPKDGGKICRWLMWAMGNGMDKVAYLAMSKLNRKVFPLKYEAWYVGELDMSKAVQKGQDSVTVNVMEGGLGKVLKAKEDQIFEVPVDTDLEFRNVYFDGLPFTNKVTWVIYGGQTIQQNTYYPGMGIIAQDGTSQGIIVQDVIGLLPTIPTTAYPNEYYFFWSVDKIVTVNYHATVSGKMTDGGSNQFFSILIQRVSDDSNVIYENVILVDTQMNEGQEFNFDITGSVNVGPKERLNFRIGSAGPNGDVKFIIYQSQLEITYDVTFTPSLSKGLFPKRAFEKLTEKMTDGKYTVKSDLLDSLDDNIVMISGKGLRKWENQSSLKTSIKDFFRHFRRYGIGLSVEDDKLTIEKHEYYFRKDVIMELGVIGSKPEVSIAEDLVVNSISVGYKNQVVDKVNGVDAFNVTQRYLAPGLRIKNELDLVSPFIADMYPIEVQRSDLFGKDTTDSQFDNDIFIVEVENGAYIQYWFGSIITEAIGGQYYIRIPEVRYQLDIGMQIDISGASSNNGTYTILNVTYLVAGFTTIQVAEPVTSVDDLFGFIHYDDPNAYKLKRPAYNPISGLLQPAKAYNIGQSPKIALLNNGPYLRSLMHQHDIDKITFTSGERNSELTRTLNGVTISEKADVVIGSLGPRLFLPYYFRITTSVPLNYLALMRSNPYGRICFIWQGVKYYGYMWDGGIKPAANDKQEWLLLAAAENDMTKLI